MFQDSSLLSFTSAVASKAPLPGGGCVSALAGSLAAALAAMVARLTYQKKQFAPVAEQMRQLCGEADRLRTELLGAVDADAQSYRQVLAAMGLPKETDDDRHSRNQAIQTAFKQAAQVPLHVAELSLQVLELTGRAVRQGNPDMVTDAAVGTLMARAAILGAVFNVKINLASIKDSAFQQEAYAQASDLEKKAIEAEGKILALLSLPQI